MNRPRETIHIAMCANDRYCPGLYGAIGSAIRSFSPGTSAMFHVIDAGLSPANKKQIDGLVAQAGGHSVHWVHPPDGRFERITPGKYHISACYRLALPELLDVERVIYLDADMLVLSCLGELWAETKKFTVPACAVKDWETSDLASDCKELAELLGESRASAYFNSGLLVLDLAMARDQALADQLLEVMREYGHLTRFADQAAINFCLAGRIHPVDPGWNTPAWAFDKQANNNLPRIIHFTNQAPWLVRRYSPSQALFERVLADFGLELPLPEQGLTRTASVALVHWLLAPLRIVWHGTRAAFASLRGEAENASVNVRIFRHWLGYWTGGPSRCFRYRRRVREIRSGSFRPFY